MRRLLPLSSAQLARSREALLNPQPGGAIERAIRHGVDPTLMIEQLALTPAERGRNLESAVRSLNQVRGIARRR
jgi:hypothetical protein